jgi:TonB family protein
MCAFAQTEKELESLSDVNIEKVEISEPHFTGTQMVSPAIKGSNMDLVKSYMAKNVIYPKKSVDIFKEGTEVVQFVVTAEGKVTDFEIINSVSKAIDEEVIRALKTTSGMWIPGKHNGIPTAHTKEITMRFKIDETDANAILENFTQKAIHHYLIASKNLYVKQNNRKALRHFNMGMQYLPNDDCLLTLRGLCKYELGDKEGARKDWERRNILTAAKNNSDNSELLSINSYDSSLLKGYAEMISILEE